MEFYTGIGIMVFIVVYLVVLLQDENKNMDENRLKQLQSNFGEEFGLKVYKGVVEVGMTEAMVIAAKGKPKSQVIVQNASGKTKDFTYQSTNEEGQVVSTDVISFVKGKVENIKTKIGAQ